MPTQCTADRLYFEWHHGRRVQAAFTGGRVTSDAGGLLLRQVELRRQIVARAASCFRDYRDPNRVEHSVDELVAQRIYGLALGYEDLNDHDELRRDPLLAVLVGKSDVLGEDRSRERDQGCPLAGKSTLNRLERAAADGGESSRYHKFGYDPTALDLLLVELFLESMEEEPDELILDIDATDDPVHGEQEGRFFHGYFGNYCYLPLYIFCGDFPLCARLRPANIDASAGAVDDLARIVSQIRQCWPNVRLIVRGDSAFARDEIMSWCEDNDVDYVFGLARNSRLVGFIERPMEKARRHHLVTQEKVRFFDSFGYRTRKTWSRRRRVIAKLEYLSRGPNPRFVVTSLPGDRWLPPAVYDELYCARGEMENRIKEQQLDLFADRTSTSKMASNQLRLYLSTFAYVLLSELRRLALRGSRLARAYAGTIRLRLLKIGAVVRVSVRRVYFSLSSAYPYKNLFRRALTRLRWGAD
jgi:hypothetical protein